MHNSSLGICTANPESSFGDISRMVGNEWKNLPASVKQNWEDRASRINEETAARHALMDESTNCASPGPNIDPPSSNVIFECLWDKCDFQFEDSLDCMEHCLAENTGHVQRTAQQTDSEYCCLWRNCIRVRKNMQAFPSLVRLIKHVREVHLSKPGKIILPNDRSKNFVARKPKMTNMITQQMNSGAVGVNGQMIVAGGGTVAPNASSPRAIDYNAQMQYQPMLGPPPEPMFITVPPRPQRVLHSEAYIKYIASLQGTSHQQHAQTASNWKKAFNTITPADVKTPKNLLPSQWLGKYAPTNQDDVVKALCHLRNFMMDDVLQIQRSFNTL